MIGKKTWVFPDGDLPPPGDKEPHGHESLVIINSNKEDAEIDLILYFEDKPPEKDIKLIVKGERVKCFRLDKEIGDGRKIKIPFGQYALILRSSEPVVAQIGRMDIRQPNLAYYTVMGYGE